MLYSSNIPAAAAKMEAMKMKLSAGHEASRASLVATLRFIVTSTAVI
jgi:hypothetical protein